MTMLQSHPCYSGASVRCLELSCVRHESFSLFILEHVFLLASGPTYWFVMHIVETAVYLLHSYRNHVVGQLVASASRGATSPARQL